MVGTYRMHSGLAAAAGLGCSSAQEFELAPYECIRERVLELGRASIDREHRSSEVLTLLWRRDCPVRETLRAALPDWLLFPELDGSRGRLERLSRTWLAIGFF